ncbi:polysaccharide deacetylase [Streptomyces sp. NPDC001691]|uniref:polysaccharide deacetylase n=1 Tax=unclassified Streptomyces TaxID=2593676 RepID=UPI000DEA2E38|nr:polysaccharide deacetylase [Streptomyces sp. SDr-06]RCH67758.1 polysaccharide deacetylase [Streptomyces sp. SDr-06]
MKKTMRKAAGVIVGLALAGTLGAAGVAEAQAQPSVAAPAVDRAGAGGSTVEAPASVVAELKAATTRARASLAPSARVICYAAHVQDIGWQSAVCDGSVAGTTGQSRRMEALAISTSGVGGVCADAHLADIGWQGWACGRDGDVVTVGTTGQSRRMEALGVQVGTGSVGAQAHVEGYGWLGSVSGNPVYVGTTGQSRRMEAVRVWV